MDNDSPGFTINPADTTGFSAAFWHDDGDWAEADLPPRRWVAPGYLLRGSLSVMVGAPGASKSTLALGWAIALALGESFGRFSPMNEEVDGRRRRVLVINTEDDDCEQRRRLSALLRQFGKVPRDLTGRLMRAGPNLAGTIVEKDALTGSIRASAGLAALEEIITSFRPDVLILDPLVELFAGIDENANGDTSAGLSILRALAARHRMAILLLHHVRKGAVQAGDMDSARGASALIGKVRVGMTLTSMTEEEAAQLGIPADARRHFLRLDDGKNSYAQAGEAQWFERASIELDNGDTAPTLSPWSPPKAKALTLDDLAAVAAAVKAGAPGGAPYSPKLSGDARSVKHALEASGIIGKAAQDAVLAALRKECGMSEGDFQRRNEHGQKRGTARGLRIGQLPAAEWTAASEATGTSTSGSDGDERRHDTIPATGWSPPLRE